MYNLLVPSGPISFKMYTLYKNVQPVGPFGTNQFQNVQTVQNCTKLYKLYKVYTLYNLWVPSGPISFNMYTLYNLYNLLLVWKTMVWNDVTKSQWVSDGLSDELHEMLELLSATKKIYYNRNSEQWNAW